MTSPTGRDHKCRQCVKGIYPSGDDATRDLANAFYDAMGSFDSYVAKFLVCEFLNLVVVIAQIYITDQFIGGKFVNFGSQVNLTVCSIVL